jgi:hypothetical protein
MNRKQKDELEKTGRCSGEDNSLEDAAREAVEKLEKREAGHAGRGDIG